MLLSILLVYLPLKYISDYIIHIHVGAVVGGVVSAVQCIVRLQSKKERVPTSK